MAGLYSGDSIFCEFVGLTEILSIVQFITFRTCEVKFSL